MKGLVLAGAICAGGVLYGLIPPAVSAGASGEPLPLMLHARTGRVLTLLDYFEGGRRALEDFVRSRASTGMTPELDSVIERCKSRCVRIELRSHVEETRYESVVGSGVLIDGGRRLLTAGHLFAGQTDYQVVVTLPDGETRESRVLAWKYEALEDRTQDWAILELLGPGLRSSVPPVRFGRIQPGELAIVLGYPDHIGVDAHGEVAYASTAGGGYLQPLVTLGAMEQANRSVLSPRVGAVPIGGMSGGPVFNTNGELVGIFVSLLKATTGAGVVYSYGFSEIDLLRERLRN